MLSIEICAGGGGQAAGLESAGFEHLALVEIDAHARATLSLNRPEWNVDGVGDVTTFDATPYKGEVSLLAGGVPCPPFSAAGKQLGSKDERDLFPAALALVDACEPQAVMLENVRGLLDAKFAVYRSKIRKRLESRGYRVFWEVCNASDFGVPQLRPRSILVAVEETRAEDFSWPEPAGAAPTVGEVLFEQMASAGWEGAGAWAALADDIAPTLVGGSKKHGGPDLGPTRAKRAWAKLGVDGHGLADGPPPPGFDGLPRLTIPMTAALQGFPSDWKFAGGKTSSYRQIGNAFPPPVAQALGHQIALSLGRAPYVMRDAA
jgi:DNA (cytosine-5)-methyltransferase 1